MTPRQRVLTTLSLPLLAVLGPAAVPRAQQEATSMNTASPQPAPARLLFRSGFEGNVALTPVSGRNGVLQYFTGSDVPGYDWSTTKPWGSRRPLYFNLIVGNDLPEDINSYLRNELVTMEGADGQPTRALRMAYLRKSPRTNVTQNDLILARFAEEPQDVCVRYRMKLDKDLPARAKARPASWWHLLFETKDYHADDLCHRTQVMIYADKETGEPYFNINANKWGRGGPIRPGPYWGESDLQHSVPVPIGRWFAFEVFLRHSTGEDGRMRLRVDGKTVLEHLGPTFNGVKAGVGEIYVALVYGDEGAEKWIDDLEVRDGLPDDQ